MRRPGPDPNGPSTPACHFRFTNNPLIHHVDHHSTSLSLHPTLPPISPSTPPSLQPLTPALLVSINPSIDRGRRHLGRRVCSVRAVLVAETLNVLEKALVDADRRPLILTEEEGYHLAFFGQRTGAQI
jgi:hypothetical protein